MDMFTTFAAAARVRDVVEQMKTEKKQLLDGSTTSTSQRTFSLQETLRLIAWTSCCSSFLELPPREA